MSEKSMKRTGTLFILVLLLTPAFSHASTIAELQAQLQVLMAQLSALQSQTQTTAAPQSNASACPSLRRNLFRGSRGTDVAQLQQFLVSQNLLASDSATGFFGAMTEAAVKQFQCSKMSICAGSPNSNGHGAAGPRTRTAIASSCVLPKTPVFPAPPSTPITPTAPVVPANPSVPSLPIAQPTSVSCTPLASQTQTFSCPSGQAGSVIQSRTSTCTTGATAPTWSEWQTTSNTCQISKERSKVVHMQSELTGFRNMYAPHVATVTGTKRMWMCGWKTDADPDTYWAQKNAGVDVSQIEGPDKIWYSDFINGAWTPPTLAFKTVGYQVCDPSIIDLSPASAPGINLYMYYTILDLRYAGVDEVKHPWTGFATSNDGGKSWQGGRILIGQDNGADGWGAWSPTAIRDGNEIWVYFNTGNQDMTVNATFRQRFALDGTTKIGNPEPLLYGPGLALTPGTSATLLANLDVHRDGNRYIMLAGTYDILNIVRLISFDGLQWNQIEENHLILIHSSGPRLATPFLDITGPRSYSVYFGDSEPGDADYKYIFRWDFAIE